MRTRFILTVLLLVLISVWAIGCSDDDDPVRPTEPPEIAEFSATPSDITPGDSTLLSYRVLRADSLRMWPDGSKLTPPDENSFWVKPPMPTTYMLVAYNDNGVDSAILTVTMATVAPNIDIFHLSSEAFENGDSTTLTWKTSLADSLVIDNGIGRVIDTDSGQLVLKPVATTTYMAVAYNSVAQDTAMVTATVEAAPAAIEAVNGLYYKGVMGAADQDPTMLFRVLDDIGGVLLAPWIHFSVLEGDGDLLVDSTRPGGNGMANAQYTFSGDLGHADIRAMVRDVDTVDVQFRAKAIIPGDGGQGQYILFDDTYADIKNFNGEPADVAEDPRDWFNYIDYEAELGVVFLVWDTNLSHNAEIYEPVQGTIFTSNFTGARTADSIGIGSTISEVQAVYGDADSTWVDNTPPVAQVYVWKQGLTFFTLLGEEDVFEMHVVDTTRPPELTRGDMLRSKDAGEGKTAVCSVCRRWSR